MIVRADGTILTNEHVILRGGRIHVTLADGREFDAKLVGRDPDSDLAVLRIDTGKSLPYIALGSSDDLMIGETVIAIGNPFGLSHTVTTGVVSAVKRSLRTGGRTYTDFIQTDASINPGNSGGPLLNIHGELIGINTAIYGTAQGIGFAIPVDRARRVLGELVSGSEGRGARPERSSPGSMLGLQVRAADGGLAVSRVRGRAASRSASASSAATWCSALDGEALDSLDALGRRLEDVRGDDGVVLSVARGRRRYDLQRAARSGRDGERSGLAPRRGRSRARCTARGRSAGCDATRREAEELPPARVLHHERADRPHARRGARLPLRRPTPSWATQAPWPSPRLRVTSSDRLYGTVRSVTCRSPRDASPCAGSSAATSTASSGSRSTTSSSCC